MANPRRLFSGLSVLGLSLFVLTGCAVLGGYDVNSLHLQPEAGLVYPGSTDVHPYDFNGSPGNLISKGGQASTGKSGTTMDTQLDVLAYFSRILIADGWRQSYEIVRDTTPEGFPAHSIQWDKSHLHLAYDLKVWTDGEATKYFTQLQSDE